LLFRDIVKRFRVFDRRFLEAVQLGGNHSSHVSVISNRTGPTAIDVGAM
jgi:hypothetical protein